MTTIPKTNGAHTNAHLPPVELTPAIQVHGLLKTSIEQIAQGWLDQLKVVQANASALETQVLAYMAKLTADLERFHELGEHVTAEATRSQDAIAKLSDGIAQIAGPTNGEA